MPRWAIRHLTTYRYSVDVRFAPHVLRLVPRPDRARVLAKRLHVVPEPVLVTEGLDAFGNTETTLRFDERTQSELRIESFIEVETSEPVAPLGVRAPLLPWSTPGGYELTPFAGRAQHPEVLGFAASLAAQTGHDPLAFLTELTRVLHARTDRQLRLDGAAQPPEETLASARGACRDLSVLFIAACRSLGMAGRFVSGYQGEEQTRDGRRHLHAWAEVWVPEHGFLGWDPMHGVAAGSGHVALAAAPEQAPTMPVEGGYFFNGPSLSSTLDYAIEMEPR